MIAPLPRESAKMPGDHQPEIGHQDEPIRGNGGLGAVAGLEVERRRDGKGGAAEEDTQRDHDRDGESAAPEHPTPRPMRAPQLGHDGLEEPRRHDPEAIAEEAGEIRDVREVVNGAIDGRVEDRHGQGDHAEGRRIGPLERVGRPPARVIQAGEEAAPAERDDPETGTFSDPHRSPLPAGRARPAHGQCAGR